ncbi:hypothetical protein DL770_006998 [Monosporascus sp. CRB-9-2]|nr:hypothetical protein DL770_006998 [Monosporascus sp. CRB-9-2]
MSGKQPQADPRDIPVDDVAFNEGSKKGNSAKSAATQAMDQAEHEARKAHSKSGANTEEGQGMDYVSRKNHSSKNEH